MLAQLWKLRLRLLVTWLSFQLLENLLFTPTLDDLLAIARDRIRLNIELKVLRRPPQPRLAKRMVEAVRARQMTRQVIVQCLESERLMEVRRLAPEISIG